MRYAITIISLLRSPNTFFLCVRVCLCVCMVVYITYVCVNVHKYMHIRVQYVCIYKCTRILCVYIYIGIYTQKFNFNTRLEDRGSCYAHIPNCNIIPAKHAQTYTHACRLRLCTTFGIESSIGRSIRYPFPWIDSLVELRFSTFSILAHSENLYNIVDQRSTTTCIRLFASPVPKARRLAVDSFARSSQG